MGKLIVNEQDVKRIVDESTTNKTGIINQFVNKEIQAEVRKIEIRNDNFSAEPIKKLLSKAEKMLEEESAPLKELINLVVKEIVVNESDIQIYMNCFDKTITHKR